MPRSSTRAMAIRTPSCGRRTAGCSRQRRRSRISRREVSPPLVSFLPGFLTRHSPHQALIKCRLEIHVADERRRIAEWKNLRGPKPTEPVLPVDPIEQIGETRPTESAGGTPGGGFLVVDHEGQRPGL